MEMRLEAHQRTWMNMFHQKLGSIVGPSHWPMLLPFETLNMCINRVFQQNMILFSFTDSRTICSFNPSKITHLSSIRNHKMYPKVKVRAEGQGDQRAGHHQNWNSLLSLKDIQFLLLQDSCFSVKEYRDVFPPHIARISQSYAPKVHLPTLTESASEDPENKSNPDEEDRPKIRASSIPRPRAVLSSPDNDVVIGIRNRVKAVQPSALKNHHHSMQRRHAQCKLAPSQAVVETPFNTPKFKDTTDNLQGKRLSATEISSQRRTARISQFYHRH